MKEPWFIQWKPFTGNIETTPVAMNEYLPAPQSFLLGLQHAFAMFGATVLAPLLMGFDPSLTMMMAGIVTILFFLITGGRVPSYLGASFSFIGVVIAATAYSGQGINPNIGIALGGTLVCGILYAIVGLIIMRTGAGWIEKLMPPVVTGGIVMIIGLNLAPVTISNVAGNTFNSWMAFVTVLCIASVGVFSRGMVKRLLLIVGLIIAYAIYYVITNLMGYGSPIDFKPVADATWFGMPTFYTPVFDAKAILLIAPVFIILIAENLGHFNAVNAMTGKNITPYVGRAFFADGICTSLSASVGATGMTTYAENIGVMAATKVYSTVVFVIAGLVAIALGLCPKFGALIHTIPTAVFCGASIVVFGFITTAGVRTWISNKIDFTKNGNLMVAALPLIMGTGNFSLQIGSFDLGGIGTATFAIILMNLVFNHEKA